MRVMVVGDAMIDVIVRPQHSIIYGADVSGSITERIGGGALTIANLLAHQGVPTTFVGAVGNDDSGSRIIESLRENNVTPYVDRSTVLPTGRVLVILDHTGERTMVSDAGANVSHEFSRDWESFSDLATESRCHWHVSGYWLTRSGTCMKTLHVMDQIARSPHTLSLGMVPSSVWLPDHIEALRQAVELCDFVFANEEEAQRASTSGIVGGSPWVVTYGARGAAIWPDEPAPSDHLRLGITDTTGAGDAFVAGVLAHWASRDSELGPAVISGQAVAQAYLRDRVADALT